MSAPTPGRIVILAAATLLAVAGCQSQETTTPGAGSSGSMSGGNTTASKPEVREAATLLGDHVREQVTRTATRIQLKTLDPQINRKALLWKLKTARLIRRVNRYDDPRLAVLGLWISRHSEMTFLESDAGRDFFGPQTQIALETVRQLEQDTEQVAAGSLPAESFEQIREDVHTFTTSHAMATNADWSAIQLEQDMQEKGLFAGVLDIPLSPFKAIGGVDRTAGAVADFADVADRFTTLLSFMPEELRWQTELLMYEAEEQETTIAVRESLTSFAASAEAFTKTADRMSDQVDTLPATLRAELTLTFDEIDAKQANLQKTIEDVQAVVDDLDAWREPLESTTANVAEAGRAWDGALGTFNQTLDQLTPDDDAPEPATPSEPSRPFDVTEYTAAFRELTAAARELNECLNGVQTAAGSAALFGRVDESLDRTTESLDGVVNKLTWRLAGLIAFAFVLALGYRFVSTRVGR